MYELNFEIPAFFVSVLCLVYSLSAKRRQYALPKGFVNMIRSQHVTFLCMLIANIISSISSVAGFYLLAASFPGVGALQFFLHQIYFLFHTTLSVTFMLYIINVTGAGLRWKKPTYALVLTPYLLCELLVITTRFTGWAFYMDSQNVYHRGELIGLLYGVGALYVVLGFIFFLRKMKAISQIDQVAVGAFIVIAALGILLQALNSAFLVELFAESLAFLVIMIVLEEKSGHIEPVTGLLNRVAFEEEGRKLMAAGQSYYIALIRLARLDKYTRHFNVRETDAFLRHLADYLFSQARVSQVYCYRRESYVALFHDPQDTRAMDFLGRVLERFEKEWRVHSLSLRMDAIATLVHVPEDAGSYEELDDLLCADYEKEQPGSYFIPIEELRESTKTSFYEAALRRAIAEEKLSLRFQPIWSVEKKRTVSAEALLRVDCPELSRISPEVYIPIAEKTGLIRDIGLFVFEEVCHFLTDPRARQSSIEYVELNLSVYQFLYRDLVSSFEAIREKYGISSSQLNLEITETEATSLGTGVMEALETFRGLGYTLSLDDFGTGYSNLIRMISSRYRNIKIDKSILWSVSQGENAPQLLRSLMAFIKTMGADIIQEGVENKAQLDLVVECGCDYIQGYYFSKPLPQEEFFAYLQGERKGREEKQKLN